MRKGFLGLEGVVQMALEKDRELPIVMPNLEDFLRTGVRGLCPGYRPTHEHTGSGWAGGGTGIHHRGRIYQINQVTDSTHAQLINLGNAGNAPVGATIASGAAVTNREFPTGVCCEWRLLQRKFHFQQHSGQSHQPGLYGQCNIRG